MIRDLLKWVAPGVATLFGGTITALAMTTPSMLADLGGQGAHRLSDDGLTWAHVAVQGRDLVLSGTTDTLARRDAATALLAALPGVRTVKQEVTLAPLADPFLIHVSVESGNVSLYGYVPNAELKRSLAARPGIATADLAVRAGQPDEALWLSGVEFALAQVGQLETGVIELSGLTLNVTGRVRSEPALGAMQMALADRPGGFALGEVRLDPVRVTPYTWTADFDGHRIAISGHVPEARLVERFRTADISGMPVATGLSLASGAPDGFADLSRLLVEQLVRLEHGNASIVDGVSRLTGAPPSVEVAQAITETLSGTGSIVQLSPPRVSDYWVSATLQSSGVLVFDGYAPDQAALDGFAENANADLNFLKLGGGAPATYHAGVDMGLKLLALMSEGRFALSGNTLSVSGIAETSTAYRAIRSLLGNDVPQNIVLGTPEIRAPLAAQYDFTISRSADGDITLTGMLPNPELELSLRAAAGPNATANIDYASGEPDNFTASAEQAIALLQWLAEGQIAYDGVSWIVSGTPRSAIDKGAIEAEFAVRGLAQAGWELRLTDPVAVAAAVVAPDAEPAPPEPVADELPTVAAPTPEPDEPVELEAEAEPAAESAPSSPSALAVCQARMAELSAQNAILFQSGNAIIAESANAELDRFAEALALCPDTSVYVEGHTDSDGDDRLNLALSVARAEAVVNALIERGTDISRLYAIGYGESQPVADNATADGKRQNRRIVITVQDD